MLLLSLYIYTYLYFLPATVCNLKLATDVYYELYLGILVRLGQVLLLSLLLGTKICRKTDHHCSLNIQGHVEMSAMIC